MTAPAPTQVLTRTLTFNFDQSVSTLTGLPDILEIAILPLNAATDVAAATTFAGGLKTAELELSGLINTVSFELIPSNSPGLATQINYRVMWRAGLTGRTETTDFAMPDEDLTWDQLIAGPENMIGTFSYVQQSDLGVINGVAQIDQNGNVIDAFGNICATQVDITALMNDLTVETNARQAADTALRSTLEAELESQINATTTAAQGYTDNKIADVNLSVSAEASLRANGDASVTTNFQAADAHLQSEIDTLTTQVSGINTTLTNTPTLDGSGHIPIAQIPPAAITNWIQVPDQTAMLSLQYPAQVQPGDIVLTPQGVYGLIAPDPGHLTSWYLLNEVLSVNDKTGAVVLAAADVGAIPVGGSVAMSQVTGLATALLGKANATDLTALQATVTANKNDPTLVHTVSGLIPDPLMPADIALINASGQVTNKSGLVVASGGGGGGGISQINGHSTPIVNLTLSDVAAYGGTIFEGQVSGLTTDLANRLLISDPSVTNARTPLPHAASHASAGSDPITVSQGQVTGLSTLISGNQLTGTSNAINRISALETQVAGGGTGGGGTPSITTFWASANLTTPISGLSDFSTQVTLHSPWGIDSDGTIAGIVGAKYYLHSGVRDADAAYPVITANGHLQLHRWNEAGAADPVYALESEVQTLNTQMANTATTAQLAALSATVDTKANAADLTNLSNSMINYATASALSTTNATVATKANQTDLAALSTTVGTKAAQSDMTTAQTNITALQNQMPTKADLTAGKLPLTETPQNIPIGYVAGLTPYLQNLNPTTGTFDASKLTNTAGLPVTMAQVGGLNAALAAKADLDGTAHVPLAEIPAAAITNVVQVANQAAMLALPTSTAHQGTICVITGTSAAGTYVLNSSDPTQLANWVALPGSSAIGTITSVNGYPGPVVNLTYTDVGAMAANATIPVGSVTGLQGQLNTFLYQSSLTKHADYVATTSVASLSAPQSVDGVVAPVGATVLLTAQASSVNNGLWVVAAGAWTRPADFATGNFVSKDTIVVVSNTTTAAGGATNPYTIWQMTDPGGTIDTSTNRWARIGWCAPPFNPVQGNGIAVSGSTIAVNPATGGGMLATTAGLSVDPSIVCKKILVPVPGGATVATLTHNLNTFRPAVSIWDASANVLVVAGVSAIDANHIAIEFGSAPAAGQYVAAVYG
jgi:hypothetical protein